MTRVLLLALLVGCNVPADAHDAAPVDAAQLDDAAPDASLCGRVGLPCCDGECFSGPGWECAADGFCRAIPDGGR